MGSGVVGAVLPVRPRVDVHGLSWGQRARWWWASTSGHGSYHVLWGDPRPGEWYVMYSNFESPYREVTGAAAAQVIAGLVAWLQAEGHEVPGEVRE